MSITISVIITTIIPAVITPVIPVITLSVMAVSLLPVGAVMPAVLDVTIPPEIIPAMSSYPVRDIPLPDKIPGAAVICGTVPAAVPIKVIQVTIVYDIIRTPHRH